MATASTLLTYGDQNRREDVVMNSIEILTAKETFLLNTLGKTKAIDTVHMYLTDTLRTAASSAVQMGADYTYLANSTPSRLTNIVEEIAIPIRVSRPQIAVQHYSGENELERQTAKAMSDWGNSAEFDLVRSTLVSGISGTVAKMNGVIANISKATNTTAHTSGTVFSATILDGLMQLNWEQSNGDVATDILVGGIMKRVTDSFAQKTNVVVNNPSNIATIVKTVTSYETAFGTVTLRKHRYVQQAADATGRVLAVRPEKHRLAYLDMPLIDTELQRGGPYTPRAVYGSLTLETRNQDSNWFASGFLLSA